MSDPTSDKHSPPHFDKSFYRPRFWRTWLLLALFRICGRLPYGFNLLVGRGIGWLFYHLAPSRKRIAQVNIDLCFPELSEAARATMVRGVIESCGISIMESAMALWGQPDKFRARSRVEGLEHVAAVQARGQGVLLVGCHFTTMDPAGRIICDYLGIDMLYRKDPNPLLAYELIKAREQYIGAAIVRSDTRQLIRHLRQGRIVWYAPDQDYGIKHSVFAPFFGVDAATVSTARIAQLGKAAVLPYAHFRDEGGFYRLVIGAELTGFPCGDEVADATRINQVIEQMIRQRPEQYLWVHRRFKTRAPGLLSFYAKKTSKK